MKKKLSQEGFIARSTLRDVAEARLREARVLFESKHYAGAVYLAGYAVECYLKLAACVTLKWESLRGEFLVHDLDGLLIYSGFDKELRNDETVFESFNKVMNKWKVEGKENLRYQDPAQYTHDYAEEFLKRVCDEQIGVVPWLRSKVS